jgi:hypothetical protein
MDADQSMLDPPIDQRAGVVRREPAPVRTRVAPVPPPGVLRPLEDDVDSLIRAVFACGFTSAAVQGRHDVSADLSNQLTSLIDTLDQAIREIRRALTEYEAA